MTRQETYEFLSNNHYHWDRQDNNHIYVWTSGYKTMDHYDIINILQKAGFHCVEQKWEDLCVKTKAVFRHK
jgi:hypothetical protein